VKKAMTVSALAVGLGLTEAGIKMLEDIDTNEHGITKLR
jgi:hypothetical protein